MSKPYLLLDVENGTVVNLENLSTQKWLDGHVPGSERVAAFILTKASAAFGEGKDKEAFLLRQLAAEIVNDIIPDQRARAARHEKEFPYRESVP